MFLRNKKKDLSLILIIFFLAFVIVYVMNYSGLFVYNVTPSLPLGYYILHDKENLKKGDMVKICPDSNNRAIQEAVKREYIDRINGDCWALPLLKVIYAKEGDFVSCLDDYVLINNVDRYKLVKFDSLNRLLPVCQIDRRLEAGEYFVMTPALNSFDSRYFGVVKEDEIKARITPFLTKFWSNE